MNHTLSEQRERHEGADTQESHIRTCGRRQRKAASETPDCPRRDPEPRPPWLRKTFLLLQPPAWGTWLGPARKLGENSDREAATWGNELPNLQTKHAPVLGGRPQEGQKKQQLETARLTIDFSCSSCKEYRRLELESCYFIYLLKKKFFTGW